MPRTHFKHYLQSMQEELLVLGSMVEKALARSMEALVNRDIALAEQVIADDKLIDKKRYDIEETCIELIATQQPLARDLRLIVAVLSIVVDMERIGDYAEGNAKIAIMIGDEPPLKPLVDLPRMSKKAGEMLRAALDAFIRRDADAARQVVIEDDEIDNLYDQVFRELLTYMAADPATINRATRLIWTAHNLERAGDRITNICERTIFVIVGRAEKYRGLK
ncbi:MAG: phosphate signaling complex protein PhoU [Dehalococcoidia bacterium]|jgi:phosphate transport system protein|nr:phosphate signaling complex protein PhoU [Dehalococcoidia bacterium]